MTEKPVLPPWLRLVYDSARIPDFQVDFDVETEQLSFPFPEPDIVIVMQVDQFHYNDFKRALKDIRPKWIFDIRASPRLDRLAGGRVHALREFDRLGTRYVDIFGLLGISNYRTVALNPDFWSPVVESFITSAPAKSGPYLALLDNDLLINSMSRHFAASISHATGKCVSLSRLNREVLYEESELQSMP